MITSSPIHFSSLSISSVLDNLRAFGPGLNPFAPYGMGNHSLASPSLCSLLRVGLLSRVHRSKGMPQEQVLSLRRQLSSRRSFRGRSERDDRGWTLLHIGARKGDLKEVKRLLDEGMDVNVPAWGPKSQGVTPLHLAAQGGHLRVMDELLERGANIDARTKGACGWTPLHAAAKERNREAIKLLIENGAFLPADINDSRFNPPLHYCPGLEWAYELKLLQEENLSGDGSCSSES